MLRKTALTQPAGQRSAVGTATLSRAVKDQGGGEGRLRRGMAGVQEWPPGLDHRRPFFDEHPREAGVFPPFHSSPRDAERVAQWYIPAKMSVFFPQW